MSLPEYAVFVDANDVPIAFGVCNIGWFFEEADLPRCVEQALLCAIETNEKILDTSEYPKHWEIFKDFEWDFGWQSKWTHVKLYNRVLDRETLAKEYCERREKELTPDLDTTKLETEQLP